MLSHSISHGYNFLLGWSLGHVHSSLINREMEYRAGKNYYFIALNHYHQLSQLISIASMLATRTLSQQACSRVTKFCNFAVILTIPAFLIIANANSGNYRHFAEKWNRYSPIRLPATLHPRAATICKFIADHGGKFARVAMLAACVAFALLGDKVLAGGIACAMTYQILDSKNLIPFKVSLFMERYVRVLSIVMGIREGMWINRIFNVMELSSCFSTKIQQFFLHRFDQFIRTIFKPVLTGYPLAQFDKALTERKGLSYEEILRVLDTTQTIPFEIDPAHCNKLSFDASRLPKSDRYEQLLEWWDQPQQDWLSKGAVITARLLDDERFVDGVLCPHFGERIDKDTVKANLRAHFDQMNQERFGSDPESGVVNAYVVDWTRQQLRALVQGLKGEVFVEGRKKDLADARENISKIIPIIESFASSPEHQVDFEDALLKLAIEAGAYCARGKKRASEELMNSLLMQTRPLQEGEEYDPNAEYEKRLRAALQAKRQTLVEQQYSNVTATMNLADGIKSDVHGFDNAYGYELSIGFLPQSELEAERIDFMDTIFWEFFESHRTEMFSSYFQSLQSVISEVGTVQFSDYLRHAIQAHPSLNDEQKEALIERYLDIAFERNQNRAAERTQRFEYLVLYMLGVIRIRS
jgi:hypothetical protein